MVPVAQLAEHLTVDQVVEGPSPFRHPTKWEISREISFLLSIGSNGCAPLTGVRHPQGVYYPIRGLRPGSLKIEALQ